ncbi:MAG TPA: M14-type cytosolic carboxypeptidase [Burkholderiaceae bacterium]|nr:M14-type cytosolic carboxypeptidase [Burkholderiaceae bacterium]
MQVSHSFDSGSIEVIACDGAGADLAIRHDIAADGEASEFLQWFHFRVSGAEQSGAELRIVNAGATTYPEGWRDYRAVASWNRRDWERIPTRYDGQVLTLHLPSAPGPSYISYFEPYSWERHLLLLADCTSRGARLRRLGASIQGRDIDALIVGQGSRPVWIIARQHPGETMAEWFVDGLLQRLLKDSDESARLRRHATFYIVPNMNPDGSVLGNLRTNAAGANLNREWLKPSIERSPEVTCVRDALHATGCDAFFDIHGDENLPYVFVAGCEMLPNFTSKQAAEQDAFAADFRAASSNFQSEHGYHASKYKDDVLKLASKYAGHTFGCLSLTLEMPFKDNANAPDPRFGWSAGRSACLGAAMLDPIDRHLVRTGSSA